MITTNDLRGSIKEFPLAVVRLMLIRQYDAQGKIDVSVFQDKRHANSDEEGFDWSDTPKIA